MQENADAEKAAKAELEKSVAEMEKKTEELLKARFNFLNFFHLASEYEL